MDISKLEQLPISLKAFNDNILDPMFFLIGPQFDDAKARVILGAIALQESGLKHRWQVVDAARPDLKGPAKGLFQFERGGGVKGCIQHPASAPHLRNLCAVRGVEVTPQAVWNAIEADDVLAAGLARLLLWTDPKPLPELGDAEGAWNLYLRCWRPGKPHLITWSWIYRQALGAVA